jgi:hypothetical protein
VGRGPKRIDKWGRPTVLLFAVQATGQSATLGSPDEERAAETRAAGFYGGHWRGEWPRRVLAWPRSPCRRRWGVQTHSERKWFGVDLNQVGQTALDEVRCEFRIPPWG